MTNIFGKEGGDRLGKFIGQSRFNGLIEKKIINMITEPIIFTSPKGGVPVYGYEATILVDICDAVIQAKGQH